MEIEIEIEWRTLKLIFPFFFSFFRQNLKKFVPKELFGAKKPTEWESAILKAHSTNLGKSAEDSMGEYLTIVKEWPFYGTTFFPPCKSINNKKLPAKITIGVNAEGILVLKKDKVKKKYFLKKASQK